MYVQDRIREQADLIWRLLEAGAHFYVCGDAAHMAGSVEVALLDIITKHVVGSEALMCTCWLLRIWVQAEFAGEEYLESNACQGCQRMLHAVPKIACTC